MAKRNLILTKWSNNRGCLEQPNQYWPSFGVWYTADIAYTPCGVITGPHNSVTETELNCNVVIGRRLSAEMCCQVTVTMQSSTVTWDSNHFVTRAETCHTERVWCEWEREIKQSDVTTDTSKTTIGPLSIRTGTSVVQGQGQSWPEGSWRRLCQIQHPEIGHDMSINTNMRGRDTNGIDDGIFTRDTRVHLHIVVCEAFPGHIPDQESMRSLSASWVLYQMECEISKGKIESNTGVNST